MPAARPTEMRAYRFQRAAATEVTRPSRRNQYSGNTWFRRASPQQRDKPPNAGPTKQQIHEEYAGGVTLAVSDDRRQKVQDDRHKKKRHVRTSSVFKPDVTHGARLSFLH
jgi:hypothetical protein